MKPLNKKACTYFINKYKSIQNLLDAQDIEFWLFSEKKLIFKIKDEKMLKTLKPYYKQEIKEKSCKTDLV